METESPFKQNEFLQAYNAIRILSEQVSHIENPGDTYAYLHHQAMIAKETCLSPHENKLVRTIFAAVLTFYERGCQNLIGHISLMRRNPDIFLENARSKLSRNSQEILDYLDPDRIVIKQNEYSSIYQSVGRLRTQITKLDERTDVYEYLRHQIDYLVDASVTSRELKLAKIVFTLVLAANEHGDEELAEYLKLLEDSPITFFIEIEKGLSDHALEVLDSFDTIEHITRNKENIVSSKPAEMTVNNYIAQLTRRLHDYIFSKNGHGKLSVSLSQDLENGAIAIEHAKQQLLINMQERFHYLINKITGRLVAGEIEKATYNKAVSCIRHIRTLHGLN